jgi:polyhydroxyalkanoate synthesis repressor PhaR
MLMRRVNGEAANTIEETTMRTIKRYANRKLYDAATSKTVTLEDIAQMVREGEEIQVIECTSEKDITNKVLAQVFLREDFDTKGVFLKRYLLEGLIKESGDKIEGLIKKFLFAGVGLASVTGEKLESLVNELVKRGELSEDERAKFVKDLMIKLEQRTQTIGKETEKVAEKVVKVSRNGHGADDQIDTLTKKIESLTAMVAELQAEKAKSEDTAKTAKKAVSSN